MTIMAQGVGVTRWEGSRTALDYSDFGVPDDPGFVTALYRNSLHREPDAEGLMNWLAALANSASRVDVVLGFSESAEHVQQTASLTMGLHPGQGGIVFA
ncbi:DUF4214 domain-containing protein [Teichococcus wenyumeiae]|nr:DUF4214 domain-containing protein [Pseudoroseomonas wenyumeiae]